MTDEVSETYASDRVKRSISKCSYQPKKAGKDGYVMNLLLYCETNKNG